MVVKARVGPQRERTRGAGCAHPVEGLGEKAGRSSARVGVTAPQARVHHVAGASHGGHQGVIAPHVGVAEHAALLGQPVGLTDGRVDIDGDRCVARTGSGGPGPPQQLAGHLVELAGVAPAERTQERAERRGREHPVAQHRHGVTRAQHVGVVDGVAAGQRRVDEGHRLVADIGASGRITEIDVFVEELAQSEVLGQRRRQHQPSVGHQMLVVEGHVETVETVTRYAHRNSAFR